MKKIEINFDVNIDNSEKEFYNKLSRSNIQIFTYLEKVLIIMICNILREIIGETKVEEVVEKLKGEDDKMLQAIEAIRREKESWIRSGREEGRREGKAKGREEEKQKIIKEMLKRNIPVELISEITHFSQQMIMNIAKTIK